MVDPWSDTVLLKDLLLDVVSLVIDIAELVEGNRFGAAAGLRLPASLSTVRRAGGRIATELIDAPDETRDLSRCRRPCAWLGVRDDVPTVRVDTVDTVEPLDILRERTPEPEPPEPPEPVDVGVRTSDCAVRNVPVSLVAEDTVEVGREEPGILNVDKPAWLRCVNPGVPCVGRTLWGRVRLWTEGTSDF